MQLPRQRFTQRKLCASDSSEYECCERSWVQSCQPDNSCESLLELHWYPSWELDHRSSSGWGQCFAACFRSWLRFLRHPMIFGCVCVQDSLDRLHSLLPIGNSQREKVRFCGRLAQSGVYRSSATGWSDHDPSISQKSWMHGTWQVSPPLRLWFPRPDGRPSMKKNNSLFSALPVLPCRAPKLQRVAMRCEVSAKEPCKSVKLLAFHNSQLWKFLFGTLGRIKSTPGVSWCHWLFGSSSTKTKSIQRELRRVAEMAETFAFNADIQQLMSLIINTSLGIRW